MLQLHPNFLDLWLHKDKLSFSGARSDLQSDRYEYKIFNPINIFNPHCKC